MSLDDLLLLLRDCHPVAEYRFHPTRKWRFDYAIPELRLAIEREGGIYTRGRHTRGKGYAGDCEKYDWAAVMGWTVIRVPASGGISRELADAIVTLARRRAA